MNTENLNNTIDQILGFITNQVSYVIDTTSGGLKNISQGAAAGKEWNWNFSDNSLANWWISYGNNYESLFAQYNTQFAQICSTETFVNALGLSALLINTYVKTSLTAAVDAVGSAIGQGIGVLTSSQTLSLLNGLIESAEGAVNNLYEASLDLGDAMNDSINSMFSNIESNSALVSVLTKGIAIFSNGALASYQNGISETSFGYLMENSWSKTSDSFLNTFASGSSSYTVTINNTTPFDPGENQSNLYGTMMLGAPPIFNNIADPRNRSIINTFLRDGKFLSLTPGYPKYNGSNYLLKTNDDALHQTTTGESMLTYLLKNGIDKSFTEKDRRYYTFKTNYEDYYAYLETMLNTLWIKMGLGPEDNTHFNIISFFDIVQNGKINPDGATKLLPRYQSSFGFYINPDGVVTESLNSQMTTFGSSIASDVNSQSETFQQINYLTGMGTGGAARESARKYSNTLALSNSMTEFVNDVASNTISTIKEMASGTMGAVSGAIKLPFAVLRDTTSFLQKDNGAVLQSFATTNGMRVVYPELWSDSGFSKTVNINFEFISPYGDPLSIFKYVMAPFAALLCYAMPRQASDNGFVSPFFVRADIPGLFTMDLGLITDFTWTRGGSQNLWTKDGLPRAISGSFTISDLYPFLAMTKRFSFLSANPNYTILLDNLAGFHAVYDEANESGLNDYWKEMLNRVSGELTSTTLWNKYSTNEREIHKTVANTPQTNRLKLNGSSIKWLRGIK